MVLSKDFDESPHAEELRVQAGELYSTAKADWETVRAKTLARVTTWKHATGRWFSPFDPIGPEQSNRVRGKLTDDVKAAAQSAGFDENENLVVLRAPNDTTASVRYFEYDGPRWVERIYVGDSAASPASVTVGLWLVPEREAIIVRQGSGTTTTHLNYPSLREVQVSVLSQGDILEYEALLDSNGHPTRVTYGGHVLFTKRRGNLDQQLPRLKKLLLRDIPKIVAKDHAGHELYAVCLSYGLGEEQVPPAVIGCRVEDFPKLRAKPGRHWDAGPLPDVSEPNHFSGNAAVLKLSEAILLHQDEETFFKRVEQLFIEIGRELTSGGSWPKSVKRAPGFVVYPANFEDGDWQWQLEAVLDKPTRAILKKKGWLPK